MIKLNDRSEFDRNYPDKKARINLKIDSPLLAREALIDLCNYLDPALVEFNPGDLPISIGPENVPKPSLSAAETIAKIGQENAWMTLRNIEHRETYSELINKIIDCFADQICAKSGEILQREAFIFISSPGAVTPFHFDEEHNILIQIEGSKEISVYSQNDRDLASQLDLERFHSGAHRNLILNPDHINRGDIVTMAPGDGLYIPPLAPHWVRVTGDKPALSLSVTWRSMASKRTCYLHQINHRLRAKGAKPRFPGQAPLLDQLKIWITSAKARMHK